LLVLPEQQVMARVLVAAERRLVRTLILGSISQFFLVKTMPLIPGPWGDAANSIRGISGGIVDNLLQQPYQRAQAAALQQQMALDAAKIPLVNAQTSLAQQSVGPQVDLLKAQGETERKHGGYWDANAAKLKAETPDPVQQQGWMQDAANLAVATRSQQPVDPSIVNRGLMALFALAKDDPKGAMAAGERILALDASSVLRDQTKATGLAFGSMDQSAFHTPQGGMTTVPGYGSIGGPFTLGQGDSRFSGTVPPTGMGPAMPPQPIGQGLPSQSNVAPSVFNARLGLLKQAADDDNVLEIKAQIDGLKALIAREEGRTSPTGVNTNKITIRKIR
jgi:hypothetical protein